jgi:hypothetical protein
MEPQATNAVGYPEFYIYKVPSIGTKAPEVKRVESFAIESDLIDQQSAGDNSAAQLALVPVRPSEERFAYWKPREPLYVPLNRRNIETIEIRLRTAQGIPVRFPPDAGKVMVRLHIRPSLL